MISVHDIYDKNVNLLIGSGASFGLLPTLSLKIQDPFDDPWSLERLGAEFANNKDVRLIPLFMHYYQSCIRPAQCLDPTTFDPVGKSVLNNYTRLLETLLAMLVRRPQHDRRCNIFTTNYDGCVALAADEIMDRSPEFILNDGTRGFRVRKLAVRNFNSFYSHTGVFDRHQTSLPQINLVHLHGSVSWRTGSRGIEVDYHSTTNDLMDQEAKDALAPFSEVLMDQHAYLEALPPCTIDEAKLNAFWAEYKKIPIVNPTEWKFHETLYEEHYYQMLRMLSYELEKPNAILITFGFSFADEHIRNLIVRSLSNPQLQVYVCCYDEAEQAGLMHRFGNYKNVSCICLDGARPLDFEAFNSEVFTLSAPKSSIPSTPGSSAATAAATAS